MREADIMFLDMLTLNYSFIISTRCHQIMNRTQAARESYLLLHQRMSNSDTLIIVTMPSS